MPKHAQSARRAFLTTMARIESACVETAPADEPYEEPPTLWGLPPCPEALTEPALAFLRRRHGPAVGHALREGFFGGLSDAEFAAVAKLPADAASLVEINSLDWLLAEGVLELADGPAAVIDLLVQPGGAKLADHELDWIDALGRELLSLYEVVAVAEYEHVSLRDALTPAAATRLVYDPDAAEMLRPGEIVGLRLVTWEEGLWISGALYPLPRQAVDILRGLRSASLRAEGDERRLFELVLSQQIVRLWLRGMVTSGGRGSR